MLHLKVNGQNLRMSKEIKLFDTGIVVFSGKDCPSCKTLKDQLNNKEVSFVEYDIWENSDALDFVMSKGLRGIPQLFKDGVKVEISEIDA